MKLIEVYSYLQALRNALDVMDLSQAVRVAELSVGSPPWAKQITKKLTAGSSLRTALMSAGFPKDLAEQLSAYEQTGVIKEGLDNTIKQLEKLMEIESTYRKIDRDMWILGVLIIIAFGVAVFFYLPVMVNNLLAQVGENERLARDAFLRTVYELFYQASYLKRLAIFIVLALPVLLALIFKVHRRILFLIPSYRKLLIENDKSVVFTLFLTAPTPMEAVRVLSRLYREKYRLSFVAKLFTDKGFNAFTKSPLFNEVEKGVFKTVAQTGNLDLFQYLLSEVERRRTVLLNALFSTLNLIKLIIVGLIVIGMYGFMFYLLFKVQQFMRGS